MDDDYGSQLADYESDQKYYAERNMCPDCETKYDKDGNCACKEHHG